MTDRMHADPSGFDPKLVAQTLDAALAIRRSTPVFGIVGLQGSGKSTLAGQVAKLASARGLRAAVLSLDDFYLGHRQRQALAQQIHPLLATRGPPGTHDLPLALATMAQLVEGASVALPRFDKLADDRLPTGQWPRIPGRCDLILLEGWFLKTPAQNPDELQAPVNALERDEDPTGDWRSYCNAALARDYPALWATLDALWFLRGPGFEVAPNWRWQQEQALQAAEPARESMSRAQVDRFVQFFERVSRQAMNTLPAIAERTVDLDLQRQTQ